MKNINLNSTITIYLNTVDATGAAVAPSAALSASDFAIYKDGSAIQKTTANGITVTSPFDTKVGCHKIDIDTSNATGDAGFWAAGSSYEIILNTVKTSGSVSLDGLRVDSFGIEYGYMVGTDGANTAVPMLGTLSQAEHDATQASIATLNNVAATDIVSAGPITTLTGAVANVDLVDVTTTNTDLVTAAAVRTEIDANSTKLANIPAGLMPTQAEVLSIQNNTRTVVAIPTVSERPDAGSTQIKIYLNNYDSIGNMEAPDSAPTVTVANESGTTRDGNLQHPTTHVLQTAMVNLSVGRYWIEYDLSSVDILENLTFTFTVVEAAVPRIFDRVMIIVDTTAVDFTAADRVKLDTLHDTRIPGVIQPQTGDSFARLGLPTGASVSADVADLPTVAEFNARTILSADYFDPSVDAVANVDLVATTTTNTDMRGTDGANKVVPDVAGTAAGLHTTTDGLITTVTAKVDTLLSRITSTLFSGITSVKEWMGLMAGKQVANSTALAEIKTSGAGAGTYSPTTDSLEAIRNNQSAGGTTIMVTPILVTVTSTGINSPPLSQYTYEGKVHSLTFQDADGVGIDMSSELSTLSFTISDDSGAVLMTVLPANMTNTGSLNEVVNITVPVLFKSKASYLYSLRDTANNDFVWSANEYKVVFASKTP